MLSTILIVLLVLFLIGALPAWPHSANWSYGPSGGLGLVLLCCSSCCCRAGCNGYSASSRA